MANSLANFVPEVWSKKLQKNFDSNAVFPKLVNRDFEGEIKNAGDVVHIRSFGDITINDYTRNTTINFEDLSDPMDDLVIDQQKYFAFKVDDLDKAQTNIDILEGYVKRAAVAIRNVVDKRLHNHYADVNASNIIGTSGAPITLTEANVYGYLVDLSKLMDDANIPTEGRHLVVNPAVKGILLKSDEFTRATSLGDKVVTNGMIGNVAGFTIHVSTNLNTVSTNTPLLAFTRDFITYASQVVKIERVRPSDMFADAVKGLYLYGSKVASNHDKAGAVLWVSNS